MIENNKRTLKFNCKDYCEDFIEIKRERLSASTMISIVNHTLRSKVETEYILDQNEAEQLRNFLEAGKYREDFILSSFRVSINPISEEIMFFGTGVSISIDGALHDTKQKIIQLIDWTPNGGRN
ncbi:hypothetical protein BPS10C_077 [Bacillus phage BPS10C]|uniref:Uncharacterized protein n=1 Tax=Bacillus phage BPS10C TaxID=1277886 RepID=W5QUN8_9CAUD|nr:hypothetical protein BPS10C_077 [Bacillus phage BPS10C]AGI12074.1 hypothetical protein BPS10C_077 [Bacillus phage BPS10C]